jgi:hypothetical protein
MQSEESVFAELGARRAAGDTVCPLLYPGDSRNRSVAHFVYIDDFIGIRDYRLQREAKNRFLRSRGDLVKQMKLPILYKLI